MQYKMSFACVKCRIYACLLAKDCVITNVHEVQCSVVFYK